jgi:hypothetical protein
MHEVTTKLLIFVDDKLMTDVTNKKSHARSSFSKSQESEAKLLR